MTSPSSDRHAYTTSPVDGSCTYTESWINCTSRLPSWLYTTLQSWLIPADSNSSICTRGDVWSSGCSLAFMLEVLVLSQDKLQPLRCLSSIWCDDARPRLPCEKVSNA
eukprot:758720-Hanusia_phi.AAC.2